MSYVRSFSSLSAADVPLVGGKNASLGEMIRELSALGVAVPDGFAVTADGYRRFLGAAAAQIDALLHGLRKDDVADLAARSAAVRDRVLATIWPEDLAAEIRAAYAALCGTEPNLPVAVRSSATAEDLPDASFAGQQESFLYIRGETELLDAVRRCFASLFSPRAIHYREDMGFAHTEVALSVGVQRMVRADQASSGVIFTLDPDSGSRDVVYLTGAWGLGENVVQGRVIPDAWTVHKPTLARGFRPIVRKRVGSKALSLIYETDTHRMRNAPTPPERQATLCLNDDEVLALARHAVTIEAHYSRRKGAPTPMDIEWAKDGVTGELFIVQARPETVHSRRSGPVLRRYHLRGTGPVLSRGLAVGEAIASGRARVVEDPSAIASFQRGEILVTRSTDPDWEPILKQAAGVITEAGGRTSHAAIVSRELGIPAVVGAEGAMSAIGTGREITLSCADGAAGLIYDGALPFEVEEHDLSRLPQTKTKINVNLADPDQAFAVAQLPVDGVGLLRLEFVFAGQVRVHPMALLRYDTLPVASRREIDNITGGGDRVEYFIDRLAQGVGTIAAAFWPRPVILRFSDFKTNEYAHLVGGASFEPTEENPMLGWRGASRYYHPNYKPAFLLEVAAVRRVREVFGLDNLHVMIPFCRTPAEGAAVLATMAEGGLRRGEGGLRVYVMAEIPSNVLLAEDFAALFDGFSIGSNDLTQLVLGVDRDSSTVAPLFDERDEAVKRAIGMLLDKAHAAGRTVSICGQGPSDHPDFAAFLVAHGIDALSLVPDAVLRTVLRVAEVEGASNRVSQQE